MTANKITEQDLTTIFELLQEDILDMVITEVDDPYGKGYTLNITKPSKQKIKVVHYTEKNKIWLQGKKEDLFNQLSLYIIELLETDEIPQFLNTVHNLNIDKDVVKTEFSQYCPNANAKLPEKMKNYLLQAVYNLKLNDDMFVFTYLVEPSLRPLEGLIKIALQEHDLPIRADDKNYDNFFVFKKCGNSYILKEEYTSDDHKDAFLNYISLAYTHFHNHRHNLSHWDNPLEPLDTTRVIKSIVEAHTLIKDTLKIIDDYYKL